MSVYINARSAVHRGSGGSLITTSVNFTGEAKVPLPYQNCAYSRDARGTAHGFRCQGYPVCHRESYFHRSVGDEPGNYGGILSATINGKAEFVACTSRTVYRSNMYLNGIPIARAGDLMVSNHRNTPPAPLQQTGQCHAVTAQPIHAVQHTSCSSYPLTLRVYSACSSLGIWWLVNDEHRLPLTRHTTTRDLEQIISLPAAEYNISLEFMASGAKLFTLPLSYDVLDAPDKLLIADVQLRVAHLPVDGVPLNLLDLMYYPEYFRQIVIHQLLQTESYSCWKEALTVAQRALMRHIEGNAFPHNVWCYIFKAGYLWREIYIDERGRYRDVDLSETAGQNTRPASSLPNISLWLILWQQQHYCQYEITLSPVQWSWQQVNFYGGLDPNDPRASNSFAAETTDTQFRRQHRFQSIDGEKLHQLVGSRSPRKRNDCVVISSNLLAPTIDVRYPMDLLNRAVADCLQLITRSVQRLASSCSDSVVVALMTSMALEQDTRRQIQPHINDYALNEALQGDAVKREHKLLHGMQSLFMWLITVLSEYDWYDYFTQTGAGYLDGFEWWTRLVALSSLSLPDLDYLPSSAPDPPVAVVDKLLQPKLYRMVFPANKPSEFGDFQADQFSPLFSLADPLRAQSAYRLIECLICCADETLAIQHQLKLQQGIVAWLQPLSQDLGLNVTLVNSLSELTVPHPIRPYYDFSGEPRRWSMKTQRIVERLTLMNARYVLAMPCITPDHARNNFWQQHWHGLQLTCRDEVRTDLSALRLLAILTWRTQCQRFFFHSARNITSYSLMWLIDKKRSVNHAQRLIAWPLSYRHVLAVMCFQSLSPHADAATLNPWFMNNRFSWQAVNQPLSDLWYALFRPQLHVDNHQLECVYLSFCGLGEFSLVNLFAIDTRERQLEQTHGVSNQNHQLAFIDRGYTKTKAYRAIVRLDSRYAAAFEYNFMR